MALIIGMLICIGLALAVVGLVAVPARREGRDVLTPRGEEVVAAIRAQTGGTTTGAEQRDATTDAPEAPRTPAQAPADAVAEDESEHHTRSRAS